MNITNVFLIEDDSFFATTFIKKMERFDHFNVHHFQNCEDAVQQIKNIKPEVVFMVLRGMKGVDAIPLILEQEAETHIVVISNQNDINIVDKAFSLGASKYFRKDILLLDYVESFLRSLDGNKDESPSQLFA